MRIRSMAAKKNLRAQEVLQMFLFERILERLAASKYQNNFILKGGLLISSMIGISERTTMDMDTTVRGIQMEEDEIVAAVNEILSIDVGDGITFEYKGIEPIREEDAYNNFRVHLWAKYGKIDSPMRIDVTTGDVIAYHLRQSFVPGEITPEEANRLGCELARRFTKGNHAFIVCTHIDKAHVHNHIIWTATTMDYERKFRNFGGSSKAVRRLNDTICIENGYSIVDNPKAHGKSYDKWLGDQAKLSHRELLRIAIDKALAQKPDNLDSLLQLLKDDGYEIKSGKQLSFRCAGQKRFLRMDTLGDGYALDDLLEVLKGEKSHTPRKRKTIARVQPQLQLAIDIQAKLQEGKGAGYARFASVFNLKQMAQAMNYIQEHNIEYPELAEKVTAATARHNALAVQIKAAEKRMGEIDVLRKHIINYSKTRDVNVAYRKSGYSKKFFAEHESEILLHKAAKKAFDDLGVTKIPTKKSLDTEYGKLLTEKKTAYGEYRQAREEMKELSIIKHNIDKLLGRQEPEKGEQEKDAESPLILRLKSLGW